MEANANNLPGDSVLSTPAASEILDPPEDFSDNLEVNAALDEAMELEDAGSISDSEKSSETKNPLNKGEAKSKETDLDGEAERIPREIKSETLNTTENSKTETAVIDEKDVVEVNSLMKDDEFPETMTDKREEPCQKTNGVIEMGKSKPMNDETTVEKKIPTDSAENVKVEIITEVPQKVEGGTIEGAVDVVEPVSEDLENQLVNEDVKTNVGENFPATAVNVEKCILVETREETQAKTKLVKVMAPKVPPPKVPAAQTETEAQPGVKPCDRITKDMVPTMKEGSIEEVLKLSGQIEFNKGVTPLALLSKTRWLVHQGHVTLVPQVHNTVSFFRSLRRTTYHIFLFNDTFVICKKKGSSRFIALNYCQRNLVLITKASVAEKLPEKVRKDSPGKSKVYITMLENHEKKPESLVLSFAKCVDRDEWIKLFKTPASTSQQEVVFELWDCPLVKVVNDFEATKPEEMTVHKDEKINVIRKCTNGFYEGERLNDQKRGYFPISATVELSSEHSRAHRIRNDHTDTTF